MCLIRSLALPVQLLNSEFSVFPLQVIVIFTGLPVWHHPVLLYLLPLLPPVQESMASPELQAPISIESSQYSEFSLLRVPSMNPSFSQKAFAPCWLFQNQ